jgi:hypothetical protein
MGVPQCDKLYPTDEEWAHFMGLVDVDEVSECWRWMGLTSGHRRSYGTWVFRGRPLGSHIAPIPLRSRFRRSARASVIAVGIRCA